MRNYITLILFMFISGCSVQVIEMAEQPTVQKFDLTDPDADGVINAREICEDSFIGANVNNNGCSPESMVTIRHELVVNFATNSYLVETKYYPAIEELAQFMRSNPSATVTIEGHTSILGSRALNLKLSQNRAQAVKNILVDQFEIDKSRIAAIGYGFDRLLVEGNSPSIHARNRRIVAEITAEKSSKDMKWTIYSVDQNDE